MKTPGFTAEASLYESNGHYRVAVTGAAVAQVLPQGGVVVLAATCCKKKADGTITCWHCLSSDPQALVVEI